LLDTSLKQINVSYNNLTGALPAEIRLLQNLEILNASNNKMTGVPAEVGQLSKLKILNLANNQLTGLPMGSETLKIYKLWICEAITLRRKTWKSPGKLYRIWKYYIRKII